MVAIPVKVPELLAHLHYGSINMTRQASKEGVLAAFSSSAHVTLILYSDWLLARKFVEEIMSNSLLPRANGYEVAA